MLWVSSSFSATLLSNEACSRAIYTQDGEYNQAVSDLYLTSWFWNIWNKIIKLSRVNLLHDVWNDKAMSYWDIMRKCMHIHIHVCIRQLEIHVHVHCIYMYMYVMVLQVITITTIQRPTSEYLCFYFLQSILLLLQLLHHLVQFWASHFEPGQVNEQCAHITNINCYCYRVFSPSVRTFLSWAQPFWRHESRGPLLSPTYTWTYMPG